MAHKPFHAFQDLVHEIEQDCLRRARIGVASSQITSFTVLSQEYEEELARLRLENTWMRQRLGFAKDRQPCPPFFHRI